MPHLINVQHGSWLVESLYILIPLALIFIALALRVFFWAVKSGQFDDLDTEGKRVLFDDVPSDARVQSESDKRSE